MNMSNVCDTDGTISREVDSSRQHSDLVLNHRPSSDGAGESTKNMRQRFGQ